MASKSLSVPLELVFAMKMEGKTDVEISKKLACSTRTISRLKKSIGYERLKTELNDQLLSKVALVQFDVLIFIHELIADLKTCTDVDIKIKAGMMLSKYCNFNQEI